MKNILILLVVFFSITAQAQHEHVCGVSHEDQQAMVKYVEAFNNGVRHQPAFRSEEDVFLPIKFHIVGDDVGHNRIRLIKVLEQFESLKRDYDTVGIIPYIYEGFNFINNTNLNNNPAEYGAVAYVNKDDNAANIFINNSAQTNSVGTTLGYYSPSFDYIVMKKSEINGTSSTLAHELGHFFSLPHTFFGWEPEQYDETKHGNPLNIVRHPISNALIELVDQSNCVNSADKICDTPPDYNFGYGASACALNKIIRDYNEDTIRTMVNNTMGYFLTCNSYQFTEGQIDIMRDNYFSSNRAYLRSDFVPDTTAMSGEWEILEPANGTDVPNYTFVDFDWEDVEGATHYAVEITGPEFEEDIIVTESYYQSPALLPDELFQVEIKPFTYARADMPSQLSVFFTGSESSVIDPSLVNEFKVMPNPLAQGQYMTVKFEATEFIDGELTVVDLTGQEISVQKVNINPGTNRFEFDTSGMTQGMYIVQLNTAKGSIQQKAVIQ